MLSKVFHAWERRLASATTDRVVRPFDWGVDWLDGGGEVLLGPGPSLNAWTRAAMHDSAAFYAAEPAGDYRLDEDTLSFSSAFVTPHPENNTVRARYFPARGGGGARRAVLVMPQWNADAEGHVGLCHLFSRFGLSALRLSLPYHDARMPPELSRADYIVSANIARTIQVCRQAVLDARRAIAWLAMQGYERIGVLGTSLGSCLALLTMAHEPLVRAGAFNHVSPYFADVVWRGLSTAHVRAGLDGHIDLDQLRELWLPISPQPFLDRVGDRPFLIVYALYDLTFPVDLSRSLLREVRTRGVRHEVAVLPCGHYTTGIAPFKWLDAYLLIRFLRKNL